MHHPLVRFALLFTSFAWSQNSGAGDPRVVDARQFPRTLPLEFKWCSSIVVFGLPFGPYNSRTCRHFEFRLCSTVGPPLLDMKAHGQAFYLGVNGSSIVGYLLLFLLLFAHGANQCFEYKKYNSIFYVESV